MNPEIPAMSSARKTRDRNTAYCRGQRSEVSERSNKQVTVDDDILEG